MFFWIFSGLFVLFAALFVFIGVMKDKKYVWQVAVCRIGATVIAALLSLLIAWLISCFALRALFRTLFTGSLLGDIGQLLSGMTNSLDTAAALAAMLVGPFVFFVFFAILRPVLGIFVRPVSRMIMKKSKAAKARREEAQEKKAEEETQVFTKPEVKGKDADIKLQKSHWLGGLLGGVCALMTFCMFLVPLAGTLEIAGEVAEPVFEVTEPNKTVVDLCDAARLNVGSVTIKTFGGGLIYDALTTYPVSDTKMTLKHEAAFASHTASMVIVMTDSKGEDGLDREKLDKCLGGVSATFEKSNLVPVVGAEWLSSVSAAWAEGEEFNGLAMNDIIEIKDESLEEAFFDILDVFSTTTKDTVRSDFKAVLEIIRILNDGEVIDTLSTDLNSMLSKEELVEELLCVLLNNKRFTSVGDVILDYSFETTLSQHATKVSRDTAYADYVEEIIKIRAAVVHLDKYQAVLDKYGLALEKDKLEEMITQLRLDATTKEKQSTLAKYTVKNQADFLENTKLVFIEDITDGDIVITKPDREAELLAQTVSFLINNLNVLNAEGTPIQEYLLIMGELLDRCALTETFGPEKSANILTLFVQGDSLREQIGFTVLQAADTAEKIVTTAEKDDKSYKELMGSMSDIIETFSSSEEMSTETIKEMMKDMDSDTAAIMAVVMTPDVVGKYDVAPQSREPVANLMSDAFSNLSTIQTEKNLTDEEYHKESEAVSEMIYILTNDGYDEQGNYSLKSPADYVERIRNSDVMSEAVVNSAFGEDGETCTNDPLKLERKLNEKDKAVLLDAINDEWINDSDGQSEQTEKELRAITAMVGVQIELNAEGRWEIVK